jgi:hypothetical protein
MKSRRSPAPEGAGAAGQDQAVIVFTAGLGGARDAIGDLRDAALIP